MTTPDLDKLEALADAATDADGQWQCVKNEDDASYQVLFETAGYECTVSDSVFERYATFIAAANPATIKALIATQRDLVEVVITLKKRLQALYPSFADEPCPTVGTRAEGSFIWGKTRYESDQQKIERLEARILELEGR